MSDDDDGSTVIIFKIRTNDNNAYGRLFVYPFFLLPSFSLGMKNNERDVFEIVAALKMKPKIQP